MNQNIKDIRSKIQNLLYYNTQVKKLSDELYNNIMKIEDGKSNIQAFDECDLAITGIWSDLKNIEFDCSCIEDRCKQFEEAEKNLKKPDDVETTAN